MFRHRLIVLLAAASLTAIAQEPAPLPPGAAEAPPAVPVPEGLPPAAPPPPAGAPAANLGETRIEEDIVEPKLSGNALAGLYRKYTGRRVIVSTAASAAEFSFVQEASPQDPLTYAEAAELLRKAAVLENFVFVEHPQDPNLDILTLATGGPRPTNVDISVFNENTPLPNTDVVITYVMTLNHIKPDQVLNIFTQVIGQFGAYGSIAAVPNASAVVITEKASLIKSLVDLQKTIDVPGSVQSTRWVPVQYADVSEIATILNELLNTQQQSQRTAGVQRTDASGGAPPAGAVPNVPGSPAAGGSGGGGEETPVQIIAEPRTNRIFAMGRPVDLIFVESLVREFDIPSSDKTFMRRKLRFLTVSEFLPIAGDAIARAFSGTGEGAGGGTSGGGGRSQGGATGTNRATQQSSAFGGGNTRAGGTNFGGASSFGGGSNRSSGGIGGGGSALSESSISSAPESMVVGRTQLIADNITNSIVASGPPSALEIIERLLDQIDVKPEQVMISTVIGQLSLNNNLETGFDYLVRSGDVVGRAGGGFGPAFPILPIAPGPGTDPSGFNPGSLIGSGGLRAYGTVGDLTIFMKALQSRTDFTVLSRPSIFTSNNQKGTISSGERIAIPTEGGTSTGSFSSGTRIEYQDVVLKLEVIPLVNSNNEITMQIALLNDEQSGTQIIEGAGTNGGDLSVPRITTREILTTATVPNNNTIVLGGLIVSRDNQTKSGIPILSDIPYLGRLFSTNVDGKDRSELMVFIQPSIVNNDRALHDVQVDMDNRYRVSGDSRNFADGAGVLPGVDELEPVDARGKNTASPIRKPAATAAAPAPSVKPSIRPVHRR
jgi:general secretion pathway protein D